MHEDMKEVEIVVQMVIMVNEVLEIEVTFTSAEYKCA